MIKELQGLPGFSQMTKPKCEGHDGIHRSCARQRDGQLPGSKASQNWSTERGDAGPGPPHSGKKSQLEPSRDGENMRRDREEPILDMMEEDKRPIE
jgi:hypothetical protein